MEKNVAVREWCLDRAIASYTHGRDKAIGIGRPIGVKLDIAEIIKMAKTYEKYVNNG